MIRHFSIGFSQTEGIYNRVTLGISVIRIEFFLFIEFLKFLISPFNFFFFKF